MNKTWLVAKREWLENLRTKAFWIGILVFPVILTLAILVPMWLQSAKSDRAYAVIDDSGWLLAAIDQRLANRDAVQDQYVRVDLPTATDRAQLMTELNRQVGSEELFAYFVLGEDPVDGDSTRYVSSNLTDDDLRSWFGRLIDDVVLERRIEQRQIDPETAAFIQASVPFEVRKIGAGGDEEAVDDLDRVRQWAPAAFVYLLWISVFSIVQMLLTNTIEEKSNRIMEVLLSSISPLQLMAGKITGIALTGLTMVGSWLLFLILAVTLLPRLLGGELGLPLGEIAADPIYLGSFVVYFILGYLFYSGLLVGIGSVCNSLKEAQNLQMPITVVLMLPLFSMVPIAEDPNGLLARVMSFIPPFTPFVMMNRAAGPPAAWEYAVTTALLLASVAVVLWAAAKIFRIGVLMTGKPPRPSEILRWIKAPVGVVPERRTPSDHRTVDPSP